MPSRSRSRLGDITVMEDSVCFRCSLCRGWIRGGVRFSALEDEAAFDSRLGSYLTNSLKTELVFSSTL